MHLLHRVFNLALASVIGLGSQAVAQQRPPTSEQAIAKRLASELMRTAVSRIAGDPLTVDALHIGVAFMNEALALDPDNVELWQTALNIAQMAENEQLKVRAVERLNALDPGHEIARLMRLNAALDRYQVFEERKAAYERLLVDQHIPRIGEAVASRLALDLALLHQRRGEIDEFSRWLTKAVTWDRANRSAAAIATGFFRSQINDPVAVVELLVNLVLADPTDVTAQIDLAQLLLEHGAYSGANRLYRTATNSMRKNFQMPASGMVVDHAVALWALGLDEQALDVLERHQQDLDTMFRMRLRQQQPELTTEQLNAVHILEQGVCTVTAVVRASRGGDSQAKNAAETAVLAGVRGIETFMENAGTAATKPETADRYRAELAQKYLETAWIALWLGVQIDKVQSWLDSAEEQQPLSPEARDRFAGWLAYRTGDLEKAIALLQPLANVDIAARLGLAHIWHDQGRQRDAAREFLAIYREQPGSVIGIWAGDRLQELIGRSPGATDQAAAMDRLVASIPNLFDRSIQDPTLSISMRLTFSKTTYEPYEPINLTIELTNNTMYPLALDRNGPIRPQVLVVPSVRSAQTSRSGQLRPFIVDIGRKLRLMPRETLTVHVDLRNYWPGEAINGLALHGALVKLSAYVNFGMTTAGAPVAGLYGIEVEANPIRVDGQRVSDEWVNQALGQMARSNAGFELLQTMAMFSHLIAPPPLPQISPEDRQLLDTARVTFAETFAKLDGLSQAWLLSVIPHGPPQAVEGLQSALAIARQSPDRLVTIAYLTYHSQGSNDPMFDAARRSDDATLRALAEAMQADIRLREDASGR